MDDTWYEHEEQWKHCTCITLHVFLQICLFFQNVYVISVIFRISCIVRRLHITCFLKAKKYKSFLLSCSHNAFLFPDSFHFASVLVLPFFVDSLFAREHFCQFDGLLNFLIIFSNLYLTFEFRWAVRMICLRGRNKSRELRINPSRQSRTGHTIQARYCWLEIKSIFICSSS